MPFCHPEPFGKLRINSAEGSQNKLMLLIKEEPQQFSDILRCLGLARHDKQTIKGIALVSFGAWDLGFVI